MADLKPCPFCGGEAHPVYHENGNRYTSNMLYLSKRGTIRCKKCELTLPRVYSRVSKAIEAWNTRKPMEDVVAELEKMKEEKIGCTGVICDKCNYKESCLEGEESFKVALDRAIDIVRGKE